MVYGFCRSLPCPSKIAHNPPVVNELKRTVNSTNEKFKMTLIPLGIRKDQIEQTRPFHTHPSGP